MAATFSTRPPGAKPASGTLASDVNREARPRALVTGGAGFLGGHLCERLIAEGYLVLCVDNLSTGVRENVVHLEGDPGFEYVHHDITSPLRIEERLDEVYHFASPASPKDFDRIPVQILLAGSAGTHNALDLALSRGARFLLASSSEVYGDPLVQRQHDGRQERLRRGQTLRRGHYHGLPPPPRPGHAHCAHIQFVRPEVEARRRARGPQLYLPGPRGNTAHRIRRRHPDQEPAIRR